MAQVGGQRGGATAARVARMGLSATGPALAHAAPTEAPSWTPITGVDPAVTVTSVAAGVSHTSPIQRRRPANALTSAMGWLDW
jgi:hypothetical protein